MINKYINRWMGVLGMLAFMCNVSAAQPGWVTSYGVETPYTDALYITGFGMSNIEDDRQEALDNAKTQAAADLIRKVRVTVKSSVSSSLRETNTRTTSNFASVNQTVSNLELDGIEFDISNDRKTFYALAYVDRRKASQKYRDSVEKTFERIRGLREQAASQENQGKNSAALELYLQMLPLFKSYYEEYAVANILKSRATKAFEELDGTNGNSSGLMTPEELVEWETGAQRKVNELLEKPSNSLADAFEILVRQLEMQDVRISRNRVVDLNYQDSDFSSAFGAYAAKNISSEMTARLPKGEIPTITKGLYWVFGDQIEISLNVLSEEGEKLGSAKTSVPKTSLPAGLVLEPRNFEQALRDQKVLTEGNLTDGGINVEIWSDKGIKDANVVLEEGEEIKFYFRVNQPSFLQLTYMLANGMKVLLWDSYYIGIDRVNKIVEFPYSFVATPPLGVERLLVTAYSEEPPQPDTITQNIGGEQYEIVQDGISKMLARTRGLKIKQEDKVRVGVANLSVTTIPGQ